MNIPLAAVIADEIRLRGFARCGAVDLRKPLGLDASRAWPSFQATWDELPLDRYMADGGRYRRRRFDVFNLYGDELSRATRQPHYQSRDHNRLNGGIERWFEPFTDATADSPFFRALLEFCRSVFEPGENRSPQRWRVEAHQFRIEAVTGEAGRPTPEGLHRDGVDWVYVGLAARRNVVAGVTRIEDLRHRALGEFTLAEPLDSVFLDDRRVLHGVTPIEPLVPEKPAYRDALVVTFTAVRL